MLGEYVRSLWTRWRLKMPWGRQGQPTWGEKPSTILGVCQKCGAVVLEGWHREVENGFLCQRCAGKTG
jgi:hypothetical protein